MLLAMKGWRLRQAARQAIAAGDFERALALASEAQQAHRTQSGESLRILGEWLAAGGSDLAMPERVE